MTEVFKVIISQSKISKNKFVPTAAHGRQVYRDLRRAQSWLSDQFVLQVIKAAKWGSGNALNPQHPMT